MSACVSSVVWSQPTRGVVRFPGTNECRMYSTWNKHPAHLNIASHMLRRLLRAIRTVPRGTILAISEKNGGRGSRPALKCIALIPVYASSSIRGGVPGASTPQLKTTRRAVRRIGHLRPGVPSPAPSHALFSDVHSSHNAVPGGQNRRTRVQIPFRAVQDPARVPPAILRSTTGPPAHPDLPFASNDLAHTQRVLALVALDASCAHGRSATGV
jgi:hypothetical protein